jgi:hypothetical protein
MSDILCNDYVFRADKSRLDTDYILNSENM